jgi:hypothetical protein
MANAPHGDMTEKNAWIAMNYKHGLDKKTKLLCALCIGLITVMCRADQLSIENRGPVSGGEQFSSWDLPVIWVNATVDGESRQFVLDTGAEKTVVESGESHFVVVGKGIMVGVVGPSRAIDVIKVGTMGICGEHYRNMELFDGGGHDNAASPNLLGADILQGHVVSLDFERREINFLRSRPQDITFYPMRRVHGSLFAVASFIKGAEFESLFDTGSSSNLVDIEVVKNHPELFRSVDANPSVILVDVSGRSTKGRIYEVENLRVGSLNLYHSYFVATNLKASGNQLVIGADSIVRANWILDYRTRQWGNQAISCISCRYHR